MSEERFWDSDPNDIKPYIYAQETRIKQADQVAWMQGIYFYNALQTALSQFAGKKNDRYISEPILEKSDNQKKLENLSELQKENYVNQLFTQLLVMQSNFNRSKKSQQDGKVS